MGGHMAETEATVPKTNLETSAEDRAIGDAISSGDHRTALSLCARHHGTAIGRLCMAMVGSSSEADDLVQETLIDAHAGAVGGLRNHGQGRSGLCRLRAYAGCAGSGDRGAAPACVGPVDRRFRGGRGS